MERGKAYRFRPLCELKQVFGRKLRACPLAKEYDGGVVLKLMDDNEVLVAPLKSIKNRDKWHPEPHCVAIQAADEFLVIDCRSLHRMKTTAFSATPYHVSEAPGRIREDVYRAFNVAKTSRSQLHERLHNLKRQIQLGKMNNIPQDSLRNLERQFDDIAYQLGYREKEVPRARRAPLVTHNPRPFQGGRFSPR